MSRVPDSGKILVSACLVGNRCRYDGGGFEGYPELQKLVEAGSAVPVCPEELGGLPTPRPPAEIQGGDGHEVLESRARIVDCQGQDVTEAFVAGAREALRRARDCGATAAVLKARSPSCGGRMIYDGSFSGGLRPGMGVTAAMLEREGLALYDEESVSALISKEGSCVE